jgi:gliding motility-associated lipoprotein GldH
MIKTKRFKIALLALILVFTACDTSIEFIDFQSLDNATWKPQDTLNFDFQVTDTIKPKNLFLHVRNSNSYAFSNLYVITQLQFPDNKVLIDTLQYEMADKNGKLLGNGISSTKESKLFYKEQKIFPVSGSFSIKIYQAMRKQGEIEPVNLEGVQEVGFSLEKINQ